MKREALIITIDGPAASGKSSVARGVADSLGIPFVSSGLLYRAATYLVLEERQDPHNEAAILALLEQHEVKLIAVPVEPNRVEVDALDISAALHTDDVDAHVSAVAKHAGVRDWVDERLRDVVGDFVIEGRDMGTSVFPHASHKFYLTAPAEVRAQRRVGERAAGLAEVTEALRARDALDQKQLEPAVDAKHINTTELGLEDVITSVLSCLEAAQVDL